MLYECAHTVLRTNVYVLYVLYVCVQMCKNVICTNVYVCCTNVRMYEYVRMYESARIRTNPYVSVRIRTNPYECVRIRMNLHEYVRIRTYLDNHEISWGQYFTVVSTCMKLYVSVRICTNHVRMCTYTYVSVRILYECVRMCVA